MSLSSSAIMTLFNPAGDGDFQITDAGTMTGEWLTGLAGMESVNVQVRFAYGSGGTTVKALLESSLDDGSTAYDVALLSFTTATKSYIFTIRPATTALIQPGVNGIDASAGNESEGVIAAVLGDRLRLVLLTTGTYVNTTLACRIHPT